MKKSIFVHMRQSLYNLIRYISTSQNKYLIYASENGFPLYFRLEYSS